MEEERNPYPIPELFRKHFLPKYPLLYEAAMRLSATNAKPPITVSVKKLSSALRYCGSWAESMQGDLFWICVYNISLESRTAYDKAWATFHGLPAVKPESFELPEYALARRGQEKPEPARGEKKWYQEYFIEFAKSAPYRTCRRIVLPTRKETKI